MTIHFIITGGTVDSCDQGVAAEYDSIIPDHVKSLDIDSEFTQVCMKDSRDFDDSDLKNILQAIEESPHKKIVITHGTYTISDTGKYLKANIKRTDQTIVLVGSFKPLKEDNSDAPEQLNFAIEKVLELESGVYVCMDKQVLSPENAVKDDKKGVFYSKNDDLMFEKFKNKKWYRQGGLVVPFFEGPAMSTMTEIVGEDGYAGIYRGEKNHGYFNREILKKLAYSNVAEQLKDVSYVDRLYSAWKKHAVKALELIENNASVEELTPVLEDFWRTAWVIEFYDPYGEKIAKEHLDLNDDELSVLFCSTFIPKMQEEQLDLLKLALVDSPDFDSHYKEYYFIKASWADAPEYSVEEIKEKVALLKEKSVNEIKAEIKKIEDHYAEINVRKKEISSKLNKDEKKIAYFFEKLTDWRDERKVYVQKTNCYLQKYLLKISSEKNIPIKYLKFLNIYCLSEVDLELLKKRHEFCVDLMQDGKWTYLDSDGARKVAEVIEAEFASSAKEVKGMCACRGHVKGPVCVVMNSEEFKDFKDGDVLVTACTRPEFAPLMKRAAAIVTDEGGITSHAAIVSRELGVPCVIGTQKATSIFKNGMMVDVDADNGIVKIVEN